MRLDPLPPPIAADGAGSSLRGEQPCLPKIERFDVSNNAFSGDMPAWLVSCGRELWPPRDGVSSRLHPALPRLASTRHYLVSPPPGTTSSRPIRHYLVSPPPGTTSSRPHLLRGRVARRPDGSPPL